MSDVFRWTGRSSLRLPSRRDIAAGFSLAEMLVVMGVIALMMAIIVTALGHAYKAVQSFR